LFLILKP